MQVKEFPNDSWWEEDYYHLDLDCRAMIDSLGHPMHNSWTNPDQFDQAALADFFEHFNGCRKYFTASYSDYGGSTFDRLFCEAVKELHKKPENELTVRQQLIREKSCVFPSGYGGETCYIWCQFGVPQFEKFSTDFYQRGLDYVEELFGDWEDALTELEDRLRNEEVDRLEDDYPALKDINPDGWLYEWLMNCGAVHATMVDYSESSLMHDLGKWLIEHEDVIDISKGPQFRWLKEELDKAQDEVKESDLEYDACHKALLKIGDAYIKAEEELGYAFARGETEEFNAENKNMGWMPWNK